MQLLKFKNENFHYQEVDASFNSSVDSTNVKFNFKASRI